MRRAIEYGLRGIEVNYTYDKNRPYESKGISRVKLQAIVQRFEKLTDELRLLKTGGSDFHGESKPISLGEMGMPRANNIRRESWERNSAGMHRKLL